MGGNGDIFGVFGTFFITQTTNVLPELVLLMADD